VSTGQDRARRFLPLILGAVALVDVLLLLVGDADPRLFPAQSHALLASSSLAVIACTYLIFEVAHRRAAAHLAKAAVLAVAFLFWAANQFWSSLPQASLFNDIAIGLFVLDVFLVIAGWPPATKASGFPDDSATQAGRRNGV
jgi:hypothetical protein